MTETNVGDQVIEVPLEEALRVFRLLEELNAFLHQPLHYAGCAEVERFASRCYPELRHAYYDLVWSWLPEATQREVADGTSEE